MLIKRRWGFRVGAGDKLFLIDATNQLAADAVQVFDTGRGRADHLQGRWQTVSANTPGEPNQFDIEDQIVINEIMYHARPEYSRPATFSEETILPNEATWRYDYSGADFSSTFADVGFDDSGWPEGPGIFFNESSRLPWNKQTPIPEGMTTAYFRTTFSIDGMPDDTYAIRHLIDDGAAIYLNGAEVTRINLPDEPLTVDTEATRRVSNATIKGPAGSSV